MAILNRRHLNIFLSILGLALFLKAIAFITLYYFCGEVRLNHWYRRAAEWHTEPVIKAIYETLARDEARHGGAYLQYMKRAIGTYGDQARGAFAKIGVLMASANRTARALHPTNLHVNESMFPNDTVQSKLPDPSWLEHFSRIVTRSRNCPARILDSDS
jgi:hypothetical protein